MDKVLMIVLDGIGDRPSQKLNNFTPLEYAKTPNLDALTARSLCGMMYTLGVSLKPSSDVAHMALFGLDYKRQYTGRGPIELAGLGIVMNDGDLAFRGNFALLDEKGSIIDRRAGRRNPEDKLLALLSNISFDNIQFKLFHVADHRFALQVIGDNLSAGITDSDPHIENVKPLKVLPRIAEEKAVYTAGILNKYIDKANEIIDDYTGCPKTNCILLRGGGSKPQWDNFSDKYGFTSACITNNALYNGIGFLLGMSVLLPDRYIDYASYYANIPKNVERALKDHDFVFLHIQEGDLFGEDGDISGKVKAIEEIDKALSFVNELPDNVLLSVTSDHSTPCCLRAHSGDPVPVLFCGKNLRFDDVNQYGERFFAKGGLGIITGNDYMQTIMNSLGRAALIGN